MKYGNKNHNIFKIDYAKIMQNIFFYIKQKPLQPSIASFSSSSLSRMPLYQAPIIFSFKSWIAQGGRRPHAPPPGYASAVYLSETGKVQKNMYKNKNNQTRKKKYYDIFVLNWGWGGGEGNCFTTFWQKVI